MIVGTVTETFPDERRVALTPGVIPQLIKTGLEVIVECGAGMAAGFPDAEYAEKGARLIKSRAEVLNTADVILQVRCHPANAQAAKADFEHARKGQIYIGSCDPLSEFEGCREFAESGATLFAMELMPRITRAQSMDVLSSMATIAGYKAVLMSAMHLPRMFPMMMTAAGTIAPARVLVIGAGVAGLQAIASARRLGAVVSAYDVRPAVKEQVESLGAKFVELPLDTKAAEGKGGYAKEMGEDFLRRQRELMLEVVREHDVVITTAAIPGKQSPILVTKEMVAAMAPASVIIDLAAERGGNCELTQAGKTIVEHDVTICGPLNIPSTVPYHASQMYSRNLVTFVRHLVKDKAITLNTEDEITRETMVTRDGEVVLPRVRALLGLVTAGA